MRVFLDTNILLDCLLERGPLSAESRLCFKSCVGNGITMLMSDLSVSNINYITRKEYSRAEFNAAILRLTEFVDIVEVGSSCILEALHLAWKDFEDSLQYLSAMKAQADCIVTRNTKDFEESALEVLTPHDFIVKYL
uniref:PIN domain-containing protein n=2 Tax=unclassified Prevotella TaxID=2638335 RepID=A0AB33J2L1_9BACT